ncbi:MULTISPECIES: hypothetical protein [Rhodomicrobium]|uniref:hypothetical protein n=1 Tax=Rhodomicrobium TaxID=1068 RepID=UPI000B4B929F|nr:MULTISPECIES: hypothetical protein [Rhodomicrobium]
MNAKYSREDLLKELEKALDVAGPNPTRWSKGCCARLSAFIESDSEAARLYAEHKALDKVLCSASGGSPRRDFERCILEAAFSRPQERDASPKIDLRLVGGGADGRIARLPFLPKRALWGEAALLAASLVLGVYIGMSGEAVQTLRGIDIFASNDQEAGMAFYGSLFEPSGLHEQEQL